VGWVGYITFIGKVRNKYKILVTELEGKGPLGTPRHRWKDNIRGFFKK
jgi:hypothetical protein